MRLPSHVVPVRRLAADLWHQIALAAVCDIGGLTRHQAQPPLRLRATDTPRVARASRHALALCWPLRWHRQSEGLIEFFGLPAVIGAQVRLALVDIEAGLIKFRPASGQVPSTVHLAHPPGRAALAPTHGLRLGWNSSQLLGWPSVGPGFDLHCWNYSGATVIHRALSSYPVQACARPLDFQHVTPGRRPPEARALQLRPHPNGAATKLSLRCAFPCDRDLSSPASSPPLCARCESCLGLGHLLPTLSSISFAAGQQRHHDELSVRGLWCRERDQTKGSHPLPFLRVPHPLQDANEKPCAAPDVTTQPTLALQAAPFRAHASVHACRCCHDATATRSRPSVLCYCHHHRSHSV